MFIHKMFFNMVHFWRHEHDLAQPDRKRPRTSELPLENCYVLKTNIYQPIVPRQKHSVVKIDEKQSKCENNLGYYLM